jgi:hypothetical protein
MAGENEFRFDSTSGSTSLLHLTRGPPEEDGLVVDRSIDQPVSSYSSAIVADTLPGGAVSFQRDIEVLPLESATCAPDESVSIVHLLFCLYFFSIIYSISYYTL